MKSKILSRINLILAKQHKLDKTTSKNQENDQLINKSRFIFLGNSKWIFRLLVLIVVNIAIFLYVKDVYADIGVDSDLSNIMNSGSGSTGDDDSIIENTLTSAVDGMVSSFENASRNLMSYFSGLSQNIFILIMSIYFIKYAIDLIKGRFDIYDFLLKFIWLVIIMVTYKGMMNSSSIFHSLIYNPLKSLLIDVPADILGSKSVFDGLYDLVKGLLGQILGSRLSFNPGAIILFFAALMGLLTYVVVSFYFVLSCYIKFFLMMTIMPIAIICLAYPSTRQYAMGIFSQILSSIVTIILLAVFVVFIREFTVLIMNTDGNMFVTIAIISWSSTLMLFEVPAYAGSIVGNMTGSGGERASAGLVSKGVQAVRGVKSMGLSKFIKS